MTTTATRSAAVGLMIALASAAAFGTSGAFVKPLLDAGWSPVAAVAVRAGGGGLVLLLPAVLSLRGRWGVLLREWRQIVAYALIAVVGCQVFYFGAIQRLDVGTALLIEYSAPVLLVLYAWGRTRVAPRAFTIVGAVVSIGGLALVVGPGGSSGYDLLGVGLAAVAALCLAGYYLLVARPSGDVPPVALVSVGLLLASLALGGLGLTGLVPFTASFGDTVLLGTTVPWWIPMGVVVLVATAFAYLTGLLAARRLGSRVASFVGLAEVLFAIVLAWLLLGQVPTLMQAAGGVLIVVGVVLVKLERAPDALTASTSTSRSASGSRPGRGSGSGPDSVLSLEGLEVPEPLPPGHSTERSSPSSTRIPSSEAISSRSSASAGSTATHPDR